MSAAGYQRRNQWTGRRPLIERLADRIETAPGPLPTDCWIANFTLTAGYPTMTVHGASPIRCHVVAYEHFVGAVPKGMHVDHLCRVLRCCNPKHLEVVTPRENFLRGAHPSAITNRTNVCKRGHPMDDAYQIKNGRACRQCSDEGTRRRRDAKKAAS